MNNNKFCQIDISEVKNLFNKFSEDKRKDAMFKALKKGGEKLVEETKRNLSQKLPNADRGKRFGKPMSSGVKLKKDKYDNEVLVHILGDFRLKFFELGTDDRYTKKKVAYQKNGKTKFRKESNKNGYRGKIEKPLKFFEDAYKNQNEIINVIDENLITELNKLLK